MKKQKIILIAGLVLGFSSCTTPLKSEATRDPAQVRKTGIHCQGTKDGNVVKVSVSKEVNHNTQKLNLKFSASADGTFQGQTGLLSGQFDGDVDPRDVSAKGGDYDFTDKAEGHQITLSTSAFDNAKLQSISASGVRYPGELLSIKIKTANPALPYLLIKGIKIRDDKTSADVKLISNLYVSDGTNANAFGQIDLDCSETLSE